MANTLNLGTDGNWGVKKDSLLGYNSENGNFKPLPFDFTRASSATVVNKAGLIETVGSGEPRIDFSNDAKGALLLEPSRSNLVTYSEDFSDAYWAKSGLSTPSGFVSPDRTNNAYKLVEDTSTGEHVIYKVSIGYTSGATLSYSFFAKKGERNVIQTYNYIGGGYHNGANFDLSTGIVSNEVSGSGTMLELDNGWYRCEFTSLATVGQSSTNVAFRILNSADENNYTGDGTSGVYIYGAQLEVGSYATSYIPNFGNSAGATRSADACNNGGNEQVINSTEGVLYAEFKNTDTSNYKLMSISDGTGNNRVFVGTRLNTGYIYYFVVAGGATQASYISTQLADNFTKVAVKFKANDFSFWINGLEVSTDLSGSVPIGLNVIQFNGGSGTLDFNGNCKDLRVYNTALTDSELQALTK